MKSIRLTFVLVATLVGGCQSADESVEAPTSETADGTEAAQSGQTPGATETPQQEEPALAAPEVAVATTGAPGDEAELGADPTAESGEAELAGDEVESPVEVDVAALALQPALDLLTATQSGDYSLVAALCDPADESGSRPVCNAAFGSLCAEGGPGTLCTSAPDESQIAELSTLLHTSSLATSDVNVTLGVDEMSATFIVELGPERTERVMFYTVKRDSGWYLYDVLDVADDAVFETE